MYVSNLLVEHHFEIATAPTIPWLTCGLSGRTRRVTHSHRVPMRAAHSDTWATMLFWQRRGNTSRPASNSRGITIYAWSFTIPATTSWGGLPDTVLSSSTHIASRTSNSTSSLGRVEGKTTGAEDQSLSALVSRSRSYTVPQASRTHLSPLW